MARGGIGVKMGMGRWVFAWMLQGWDGVMARVMKEATGSVGMKVGMVGLMVERGKVMACMAREMGMKLLDGVPQ